METPQLWEKTTVTIINSDGSTRKRTKKTRKGLGAFWANFFSPKNGYEVKEVKTEPVKKS